MGEGAGDLHACSIQLITGVNGLCAPHCVFSPIAQFVSVGVVYVCVRV